MRTLTILALLGLTSACTSPGIVLEGDPNDTNNPSDGVDDGGEDGGEDDPNDADGDGTPDDVDDDGDGFSEDQGDCDDTDGDISPDGDEGDDADGIDDDCSGVADDRTVCDDGLADYAGIQEGIDDAPEDFVLLICPGTYDEDLVIDGDRITLQSTDGPEVTIVQGSGSGPVLTIEGVSDGSADHGVGIVGLTFQGGLAEQGGGLLAVSSDLWISGSVFQGNEATVRGGGGLTYDCDGLIEDTTFESNVAPEGGGFVSWQSGETISGSSFIANFATTTEETGYGSGSGGGGILIYGSNTLENSTIDGNTSGYNGGGLYVLYGGPTIQGNTFSGNYSGEDGGGVYMNQSRVDFFENDVLYNEAYDDAGGIRGYICQGEFHDNRVIGNLASDDAGGMKVSHSSNAIHDNWFEDNHTGDAGGGLELDNDTSDVTNTTFIGNTAGRGAGLHTWRNEGTLTLEDLYFEGNEAWDCGGALQMDNNPYTVTARRITAFDNKAVDGGALCIDKKPIDSEYDVDEPGNSHHSVLNVVASLWADNHVSDDGAGIYNKNGLLSLTNVTITDSSGVEGAIALKEESATTLVNVDISHISGTGGILHEEGELTVSYSNFHDLDGDVVIGGTSVVGQDGNIDEDPDHVDPAGGDYSLGSGSDLRNAGHPSISNTDGSRSHIGHSGGPDA